jgi:hypothetical protein
MIGIICSFSNLCHNILDIKLLFEHVSNSTSAIHVKAIISQYTIKPYKAIFFYFMNL